MVSARRKSDMLLKLAALQEQNLSGGPNGPPYKSDTTGEWLDHWTAQAARQGFLDSGTWFPNDTNEAAAKERQRQSGRDHGRGQIGSGSATGTYSRDRSKESAEQTGKETRIS
jgi:hypothetical protein